MMKEGTTLFLNFTLKYMRTKSILKHKNYMRNRINLN